MHADDEEDANAKDDDERDLAIGAIVRCRVRAIREFGVFARVRGRERDGLIHKDVAHRDLKFTRDDDGASVKKSLEYFFPIGSEVYAKVTSIRGDGKVALNAKAACQTTGKDLELERGIGDANANARGGEGTSERDNRPRFGGNVSGGGGGVARMDVVEVGKVYRGVVRGVKPVGAFVDVDGFKRGGLVHRSQISQYLDVPRDADDASKVGIISGVIGVGDAVYVKVMDVERAENGRDARVSLSMKYIDQGTGEDLDPNNLNYDPPFRGGSGGRGGDRYAPVGANAADTVKAGAIRWGHHAGDVKQYGSGEQRYDLVLEEEVAEEAPPPGMMFGSGEFVTRLRAAGGSPTRIRDGLDERDRKRKDKKEKKEKKSKRHKSSRSSRRSRRDYSSDSSS